jgi:predicted nucleotidyltransferase
VTGPLPGGFDPARALRVLADHGVRFVVIGGLAANALGSPSVTQDLDICHARDPDNLEALAAALRELNARLRGVRDGGEVPFRLDAKGLRAGDSFTFQTDAGALDILGTPGGTYGYADLAETSTDIELAGLTVKVASLESLIRMKQAAARPKDRVELEILHALQEEIEASPAGGK